MSAGAPSPLRRSLWPLALVYRGVTALRNGAYDRGLRRAVALPVAVVSIGNLTVGGTGKTPLVAWCVAAARALGRRPGVLARGYGRAPGAALNDEGMLLQARFPDLPQVQDADRVAGGRRLVAEHDVDLVLLDDGFQHRRLARDVDIVCLDARSPFSSGGVLPAGDLREGARAGLRRADVVVLTRADRLGSDAAIAARSQQIRAFAGREDLPVFAARHRPRSVIGLHDPAMVDAATALRGERVVLLSAIARPAAFRDTVEELGAEVCAVVTHRDHHRYTVEDLRRAQQRAAECDALLLTTEKDSVKLRALPERAGRIAILTIDLEWIGATPDPEVLGIA